MSFFNEPISGIVFVAALLIGLLCGALGPYLVWKRLGLLGDSVSHASLAVIALALALGLSESVLLIPFAVLLGLAMSYLQEKNYSELDSILAIFFAGFMGLGLLIMSKTGRGSEEVLHALFGDIESTSTSDIATLAVLTVFVLAYLLKFRKTLQLIIVQPDLARVEGVNVRTHTTILLVTCSVTVALCLKLMGVVLVTMLFVAPSLISLSLAKSARQHSVLSLVVGVALAVGGTALAFGFTLPVSATIATLGLVIFAITTLLRGRTA